MGGWRGMKEPTLKQAMAQIRRKLTEFEDSLFGCTGGDLDAPRRAVKKRREVEEVIEGHLRMLAGKGGAS